MHGCFCPQIYADYGDFLLGIVLHTAFGGINQTYHSISLCSCYWLFEINYTAFAALFGDGLTQITWVRTSFLPLMGSRKGAKNAKFAPADLGDLADGLGIFLEHRPVTQGVRTQISQIAWYRTSILTTN
jgi:hypothetical protein